MISWRRCPECRSHRTSTKDVIEHLRIDVDTVIHVMVPVRECHACGLAWTDAVADGLRQSAIDAHRREM